MRPWQHWPAAVAAAALQQRGCWLLERFENRQFITFPIGNESSCVTKGERLQNDYLWFFRPFKHRYGSNDCAKSTGVAVRLQNIGFDTSDIVQTSALNNLIPGSCKLKELRHLF